MGFTHARPNNAGHSTSNVYSSALSHTHVSSVPRSPKQHRHIDLHTQMNHTRTAMKYIRVHYKACMQQYAHAQTVYKDGVLSSASVSVSPVLPFFTHGH